MKRKICKSEFNTSRSSKVIKTSSLSKVSSRYSFTSVVRIFSLNAELVVVFILRVTYCVRTKTRANTKYETLKLKLVFVLVLGSNALQYPQHTPFYRKQKFISFLHGQKLRTISRTSIPAIIFHGL